MAIAKVFKSGNSQAIRLPKEFRLKVKEVELIRQGDDIVIRQPAPRSFASALAIWSTMPEDFFAEGRDDPAPQERDWEL
jgi:antitoxin VapB